MAAQKRLAKLWKLLGPHLDGMLVTSPENVRYLCGFSGSEGALLLTHGGGIFLTDGRYTTQARSEVDLFHTVTFKKKWEMIGRQLKKLNVFRLGYESRHLSVAMLQELEKHTAHTVLEPCTTQLDTLRAVKNAGEIRLLKKAARIAAASLAQVLPLIKPGVREMEVAAELEYRMRRNGGQGSAFPTIVASGARAALPHGTASDKKIRAGDLVTIDYGTLFEGYCSDETCTFVVGTPTAKQKKIHAAVKEAHDCAIGALAPGTPLHEIDATARRTLAGRGYQKYFTHGTGHGVGLCVHEFPSVSAGSEAVLQNGMVVTIEPGLYLPRWGGVRIEDTLVLNRGVYDYITCSSKELIALG